jgi:ABC-type transporter Mla subunit MlaD
MKIHTATAVMLCLVTLTTGACVSQSTLDVAVADREATKAELNSATTQSQALTEQVSELQEHRRILARQLEATSLAYRRATQRMEAERVAWQRLNKLGRMVSQLAAQQKSLKYALQRENKAQVTLQASVEQYRSELDEAARGPAAPVSHPLISRTDQPVETTPPAQVAAQTDPALKPAIVTQAAPATPPAVNPVPKPPVNQAPPQPVEQDWLSWFQEWIMSILQSILP